MSKDFQVNDNPGASRRPTKLRDQHNREWFVEVDHKSGAPIGVYTCRHKPRPPWLPDQGYFLYGSSNPFVFTIDYETMLAERVTAHEAYHKLAIKQATARNWPIPVMGETYSAQVRELIGAPPRPWQPIKAAMDGNKWILGLTTTVDARLEPFVRKETKVEKLLKDLPSFADEPEEDEEEAELKRLYAEEQAALLAPTGGTPRRNRRPSNVTAGA